MRDRASVNDKAINLLNVFYKNMMDSPCLAHTYNNVGERFHVPILKRFEESMNSAIKLSAAACRKFRQIVGKFPITGTRNRWWSRWEAYALVQEKFEKIQEWITACQDLDICKNSMLALTEIVFADQSRDKLMIELGVIVDLGKRFVQSTYLLEGDGFLSIDAYDIISEIDIYIELIRNAANKPLNDN
jgi:hypothetical protein